MRWWAQTGQILSVKSAKRCFNSLADPDNSFFHTRTQERNPKVTAKEQSRPPPRRRTARVGGAVQLRSLHRRHCRIEDIRSIRAKSVVLLHLTLRTRGSPCVDVSFTEMRSRPMRSAAVRSLICLLISKLGHRSSDFHL